MTEALIALAVLLGVPSVLMLLGLLAFEQISLVRAEWSKARRDKEYRRAKSLRAKRLRLLEQELLELEEIENRR